MPTTPAALNHLVRQTLPLLLPLLVGLALACGKGAELPEGYEATTPVASPRTVEASPAQPNDAVQITCVLPGLQALTGRDLQEAGLDLAAIDPAQLTLVSVDRAVPILLEQADAARFGPQDRLLWYSSGPLDLRYPYINTRTIYYPISQEYVLRLSPGNLSPLRFTPLAAVVSPTSATLPAAEVRSVMRLEENPIHDFNAVEGSNTDVPLTDFIYWAKLTYPETDRTSGSLEVAFELTADQVARPAELRVQVAASTHIGAEFNRNPHRITLELNGEPLGATTFTANIERLDFPLAAGRMKAGRNRLRLSVLAPLIPSGFKGLANDSIFLDWIEVYSRQTHYTAPGLLTLSADAAAGAAVTTGTRTTTSATATTGTASTSTSLAFSLGGLPDPLPLIFDLTGHRLLEGRPAPALPGEHGARLELARTTATTTTLLVWPADQALRPRDVHAFHTTDYFQQASDCELLIVTNPLFTEALQPFIAWKRARGLTVDVVETDDLYRERAAGTVNVDTIRDYIKHVYRSQPTPRLRYVMLVGDSMSVSKYVTYLPAYAYLQTGHHASENYFANFDDPTSNPLVAVGRLSVTTATEVVNYVNKMKAFEGGADRGLWRARMLLIAASEAWASNDAAALRDQHLREHYFTDYLRSDPHNSNPAYHSQINRELVAYFNAGQMATVFFGHGGGTVWEIGPTLFQGLMTKHLFDQSHVRELTNLTRPTLVFALTCYTNDFDNVDVGSTLGETFVNSPGGAIGVIGAAQRSSTYFNLQFTREFFRVLNEQKLTRLGDVLCETKRRIGSTHINQTYLLLGDPSLEYHLPRPQIQLATPRRSADGRQVQLDYLLPAETKLPAELDVALLDPDLLEITSQTATAQSTSGTLELTVPQTTRTLQSVLLYCGAGPGGGDIVGTALLAATTGTAQTAMVGAAGTVQPALVTSATQQLKTTATLTSAPHAAATLTPVARTSGSTTATLKMPAAAPAIHASPMTHALPTSSPQPLAAERPTR